jgi:hypothetical protein
MNGNVALDLLPADGRTGLGDEFFVEIRNEVRFYGTAEVAYGALRRHVARHCGSGDGAQRERHGGRGHSAGIHTTSSTASWPCAQAGTNAYQTDFKTPPSWLHASPLIGRTA